jgi:hypothetical protein
MKLQIRTVILKLPLIRLSFRCIKTEKTTKDRHSLKTPNLKSEKPFGFRNGITIGDEKLDLGQKAVF